MRILTVIPFALLLFLAASAQASIEVPPEAFGEGPTSGGEPVVEGRLIVDAAAVHPGATVRVGVLYTLDPHWHIYWHNSGQAGLPTTQEWSGDLTVGEIQWPAPSVFSEANGLIVTHGYSDEVLLWTEGVISEAIEGEATINVSTRYLACAETCIPATLNLTRTLPVGPIFRAAPNEVIAAFRQAREQLPRPAADLRLTVDAAVSQSAVRPNDEFSVAIATISCAGPPAEGERCAAYTLPEGDDMVQAFVPASIDTLDLEVSASRAHPGVFAGNLVVLTGFASADDPGVTEQTLAGVMVLSDHRGDRVPVWVEATIPRAPEGAEVTESTSALFAEVSASPGSRGIDIDADEGGAGPADTTADTGGEGGVAPPPAPSFSLWSALLAALLGGMILNIMPCVFPVLAIKVAAITAFGQRPKSEIVSHVVAYTAGIVASMLVLAGVILALRAAGTSVGWGFQFQHPLFVALSGGFVMLFALNLFGVFEIGVSDAGIGAAADAAMGHRKSFLEGILAVILATPCSAPFLGTALGFALVSGGAVEVLLAFTTIGLGLALPFAVLALSPGLNKLLPRPGNWMVAFKQLMGFLVLLTNVWLVYILSSLTGIEGVLQFLVFLIGFSIAVWIFGAAQKSTRSLRGASILAIVVAVAVGVFTLDFQIPEAGAEGSDAVIQHEGGLTWSAWTEESVAAELEAGRPVFVDFTADWCTTCKVNERVVIHHDDVVETIERLDVAMLMADWTRPDERIRVKLAEFGRAGVPMYLIYSPDAPSDPVLLPEVITPQMVVEALERAAADT